MVTSPAKASPYPQIAFPHDPGLPELPRLLDQQWVMATYDRRFEEMPPDPSGIRIRQFAPQQGQISHSQL